MQTQAMLLRDAPCSGRGRLLARLQASACLHLSRAAHACIMSALARQMYSDQVRPCAAASSSQGRRASKEGGYGRHITTGERRRKHAQIAALTWQQVSCSSNVL